MEKMKKQLGILLCAVALVFGIFSLNTLAISNEKSYEGGAIVFSSDTLYEPEQVAGYDSEKEYKNGEIISISPSEPEQTNTIETDKTITAYYDGIRDVPENRYYEEYIADLKYKGDLKLQRVIASGNGFTAIFSGQITE